MNKNCQYQYQAKYKTNKITLTHTCEIFYKAKSYNIPGRYSIHGPQYIEQNMKICKTKTA